MHTDRWKALDIAAQTMCLDDTTPRTQATRQKTAHILYIECSFLASWYINPFSLLFNYKWLNMSGFWCLPWSLLWLWLIMLAVKQLGMILVILSFDRAKFLTVNRLVQFVPVQEIVALEATAGWQHFQYPFAHGAQLVGILAGWWIHVALATPAMVTFLVLAIRRRSLKHQSVDDCLKYVGYVHRVSVLVFNPVLWCAEINKN